MTNDLDDLEDQWVVDWTEEWEDEWVKIQKVEPRPLTPPPQNTVPYVTQENGKPYIKKIMNPIGHHFSSSSKNVYVYAE